MRVFAIIPDLTQVTEVVLAHGRLLLTLARMYRKGRQGFKV